MLKYIYVNGFVSMEYMKSRRKGNKRKGDDMLTKKEYRVFEKVLDLFFKHKNISKPSGKTDKTNIYSLAEQMDFDVQKATIEPNNNVKIEGILLVDENKDTVSVFSKPRGIALNYLNTPKENRFIVAHELCHYIFEKYLADYRPIILTEGREEHLLDQERDEYEQAIDYMAAALLVPLDSFRDKFNQAKEKKQSEQDFINEMCDFYDVSPIAIKKRIEELKELDSEN